MRELLYSRELPGGGYVSIESLPGDGAQHRLQVRVERRSDPQRRVGHVPPVIAEAEGTTRAGAFTELYRIASDNVAIARGIVRWQKRRTDTDN